MKDDKRIHINGRHIKVHSTNSQTEEKPRPKSNIKIDGNNHKKENSNKTLLIILIVIIAAMIIAFGLFYYFVIRNNPKPTNTPTPSASVSASTNETPTASPKKRVGWETYTNNRFGFSLQVPPGMEKTASINGDGEIFTTWNPPMTIRVWAENNNQNLTAQQAIDFDKQDFANEVENLKVTVEGSIQMGGQNAVESVWQYTAPSTGDASTSARAYTAKGNYIYKIEFLIGTNYWNQYSTMFDDVFTSFEFK